MACIPSTGQCGSCVPNSLTCTGNQPQKCDVNGNYQNNGAACSFGCTGMGVCSPLTAPPVTVTMQGSDAIITYTASSFGGVSCVVERSFNGGGFTAVQTTTACPAGFAAPCAYDPFLVRGNYTYRTNCSAAGSPNAFSAASAAAQPSIEVSGATYQMNGVNVDAANGGTIKSERTITNAKSSVGFSNPWGIATDVAAGEIWVTSHDSNVIRVFSRTANDPNALIGSRSLNVDPENTGVVNQPIGIAVLGSEVIVATRSPAYLAGYPRNFVSGSAGPSTQAPNWWLKGTAAGLNGPFALTTDKSNLIIVGNTTGHSVTIYKQNAMNATNHTAAPAGMVTVAFGFPQGLAVDPVARELFVLDSSAKRIDVVNVDSTASTPTGLRSIQGTDAAFAVPVALQYDAGKLYVLNNSTGVVNVYDSLADVGSTTHPITPLVKLGTGDLAGGEGLAICN